MALGIEVAADTAKIFATCSKEHQEDPQSGMLYFVSTPLCFSGCTVFINIATLRHFIPAIISIL